MVIPVGIGKVSFIITEKLTPYVILFVVSTVKSGSKYLVCEVTTEEHKTEKINKILKVIFFIRLILVNLIRLIYINLIKL